MQTAHYAEKYFWSLNLMCDENVHAVNVYAKNVHAENTHAETE